jgi:exportin-2 (importin alpha re-exporter)
MSVFVLNDFNVIRDPVDHKICGIGMVRLLTASDLMLQDPYANQLWPKVFNSLLALLELPPTTADAADDTIDDLYQVEVDDDVGYQNTFSKLKTATPLHDDPVAAYPPCRNYLVTQLVSLPAEKRNYVSVKSEG